MRKSIFVLCLAILFMLASACTGATGNNGGNGNVQDNNSNTNTNSGNSGSEVKDTDPFGKFDPMIELSAVLPTAGWATFPEGETWDNENRWHKMYQDELGVYINWDWQVDSTQYNNKVNVTMASGDIPDLMVVSKNQLNELVEADMVADLTDAFEQYAMPYLKEQVAEALAPAQSMAIYDGKLMAIPQYGGDPRDSLVSLYIRTDWLEKVGLDEPRTIEDLVKVAEAFKNGDPDGDNQANTYGLGTTVGLSGGGALGGFLNGYHAYPDIWIEGSDGSLEFGTIQPEMKTALAQLQEMYKEGLIDREFATKDYNQLKENVVSEKVGMFYGTVSESALILADQKTLNMDARWKAIPLPSIDDQPAKPSVGVNVGGFIVVKKGYSNPEVAVKMMNKFIQKVYGEDAEGTNQDSDTYAWVDGAKYAMHILSPVQGYVKDYNYELVRDALAAQDPSGLTAGNKGTYDMVAATDGSDPETWQQWWIHQPELSPFQVREDYQKDPDGVIIDKYFGGSTPTMDSRMATLNTMREEEITKIIMGESTIDAFDKFVENWFNLGGQQITDEVNEWYANQ